MLTRNSNIWKACPEMTLDAQAFIPRDKGLLKLGVNFSAPLHYRDLEPMDASRRHVRMDAACGHIGLYFRDPVSGFLRNTCVS